MNCGALLFHGGGGRNRERASQYSIISPVAGDALDHYDYALLDTMTVDGRPVFRLALRPRSDATPLLEGTIDIADSTWDVLAIEAGFNGAVLFGSVENLRYEERFRDFGDGRWLPCEIRLTGEVRPRVSAARPDSAAWAGSAPVPLTDAERVSLARHDSTERHPGLIARAMRDADGVSRLAENPAFFHYNRVDGVYLGAGREWRATPGVLLTTDLGYGLGSEVWQYRFGGRVRLSESRRLWLGGWYFDETTTRPTFISASYNPTLRAFLAHTDPLDYYRERGVALWASVKLVDRTRLELVYEDAGQSTMDTVPGFSTHSRRFPPRPNPPIADGRMRSLSVTLSLDSRALMKSGGQDYRLGSQNWTHASLGAEIAEPALIADDFRFRRYTFQVERQQQSLAGSTTIAATGGIETGDVPPQRYFTIDFGMGVLSADGIGFNTLYRTNYYGTRAVMLALRHDFDRRLFARSGLPLIRMIPFTLSVHGGVFWADFANHSALPADAMLASASVPYREVGFSLGNLTPFLSPINLATSFSWQVSAYPTRRFRFGFGFTGP